MKNTRLPKEAKAAMARGWKLTPLNGKKPIKAAWQKTDCTWTEIEAHINQGGNIGVRTGAASGVIVVDIDAGCSLTEADLPETQTATSGTGTHLFFEYPEGGLGNSAGKLAPHCDIRGDGGQVVLAGSIHPETKTRYKWVAGLSPADVPLAKLPAWVLEKLNSTPTKEAAPASTRSARPAAALSELHRGTSLYGVAALTKEVGKVLGAENGERNDRLHRGAFRMGQLVHSGDLDREDAKATLIATGQKAGLEPDETERAVKNGLTAGAANPRKSKTRHKDSDLGNAERFVERFGACAKFDAASDRWYIWNGQRWAEDFTGEALRMAGVVARHILVEAAGVVAEDPGVAAKWALKSESLARLTAMLALAKSLPGMTVPPDTFDSDPWSLNCANGTVDLRTGNLRPHNPDDLLTKCTGHAYIPGTPAPRWQKFLARIFRTTPEVIPYIQRILGYALTGDTREHYIWLFFGGGRNGKSTLIEAVMHAMGAYAGVADSGLLLKHQHAPHPTALADLRGMRLAVLQEVDGKQWDAARMKSLTGDSRIKARYMHCDLMEFQRTSKSLAVGNELPMISDPTEAVWARIRVVPFMERIPDAEQDGALPMKLRAETPGILAWLVEGCLAWQKDGLTPPVCVAEVTQTYKHDSNPVARFLAQRGNDKPKSPPAAALRQEFADWARTEGEPSITPAQFGGFIKHCPGWSTVKHSGSLVYKFVPSTSSR